MGPNTAAIISRVLCNGRARLRIFFLKSFYRGQEARKARDKKKLPHANPKTGSYIDEPADMLNFFMFHDLETIEPFMDDFLGSILDDLRLDQGRVSRR